MRNTIQNPRNFLALIALIAGLTVLSACATRGDFGKFDRNNDGKVTKQEADGRIDFFDSYDKNKNGTLEPEEFRWAYSATKYRSDKKRGTADLPPSERPKGGGIINSNAGGFGR